MAKAYFRPFSLMLISFLLLLSSCTTQFEKIRTSNDPHKILKAGHKYYKEGEYLNAQSLYELAIQFFRGKKEAEELFFKYAYTYYHLGEYISAAHYFNSFASTFYNSDDREEAAFMAAYSNYMLSPNHKLDQTSSVRAIEAFQDFINNYPESPKVDQCNELIDELRKKMELKSYEVGKLYYDMKQYQAAVVAFKNMLTEYPGAARDDEAKYLLVKSSYLLAKNSVIDKRKERYEEAKKLAIKYKDKTGNSSYKRELNAILNSINNKLSDKA